MKKNIFVMLLMCVVAFGLFAQNAITITPGTPRNAEIRSSGERHFYNVTIRGNQTMLYVYTTSNIDTVMNILDASGNVVAHDDDSGEGLNAMIRTIVPAGTYTIEIWGWSDTTGPYTLHTQAIPMNITAQVDRRLVGNWYEMNGTMWTFNADGTGMRNDNTIRHASFSDKFVIHIDGDYWEGDPTKVNDIIFSPDSRMIILHSIRSTHWLVKLD
jgi:hypothetical protein